MRKAILYLLALSIVISPVLADFYNTSNLTAARNIYEQAVALNSIVDDMIGLGLLLIVFVITYTVISGNYNSVAGIGAASFITVVSATILLPLNLIGFNIYQYVLYLGGIAMFLAVVINRT